MSFFNSIKETLNKATNDITDQFNRIKNKDVMEAVVASCTLVSYADGSVTPEEKNKMLTILQNTECLKMYKTDVIIETFHKFSRKFEFDNDIGRSEVLKSLSNIKKDDEAKLIVRACIMIANSDGKFDDSEKKVIKDICKELNLNSSDFL